MLREDMAEERRRLKDEHAAELETRRQKHDQELLNKLEAARDGQVPLCSFPPPSPLPPSIEDESL